MAGSKGVKRSRTFVNSDEEDGEDAPRITKATKKSKTTAGGADAESGKDADGNAFWALSGKRRVVISEFKGTTFINIREFWTDKDGEMKPGKKGISLSLEQYDSLLKVIPAINAELASSGHEAPDVPMTAPETSASSKSKEKKANIEATSDEEEDD